jgi:hypothetical protein
MSNYIRPRNSRLLYLFTVSLLLTLGVYILRGFQVLGFIPGGVVLILMGVSIFTALLYFLERSKRW